jgi:CHASE3 domain sensor protein
MTIDYARRELASATTSRDQARAAMNAARVGSRKWRDAEEDLNFWQGKVANMQAAVSRLS